MSQNDKAKNIEAIYALSPMQQGMLFHSIYSEGVGEYHEQFNCTIHGDLDQDAFARALRMVVQRYSTLRSAFVWKKTAKMLQVVQKEVDLPLFHLDWSNVDETSQQQKLNELLESDRKNGFNLSKAPLMRFYIIRLAEGKFKLYWAFHHLLTDGWSMPIILKEVFTLYEAYSKNITLQLPPTRPYKNYIDWIEKQDLQKAETFWKTVVGDYSAPISILDDRIRQDGIEGADGHCKISKEFSVGFSERMKAFARQNQLTVNTLVQGAWALLLSHLSHEDDIVFGATVSGRPPILPDVEKMVGLFINTLPIRAFVDDKKSSLDFLNAIQKLAVDMRDYEYTPLVDIHSWSRVPRDVPLFNSIVVFENYPVDAAMNNPQSSLQFSDFNMIERVNYPLALVAGFSDHLALDLVFSTKKFHRDTIERYLNILERILTAFVTQPAQRVKDIYLLDPHEEQKILVEWNKTRVEYDKTALMTTAFEHWAKKRPTHTALEFGDQRMTYHELDVASNQWAHYLTKKGLKPEDRVAIYLERSVEMIVSILAIQKAGACYVPIDADYPADRVNYILQDSGSKLVLSQQSLFEVLDSSVEAIDVFALKDDVSHEPKTKPVTNVRSHNLAYMIYTSGSTGKPKGTLLQHQGGVNTIRALIQNYHVDANSRMLQFFSIAFDGSVSEIFIALSSGCTMCIIDRESILSSEKLHAFLQQKRITNFIMTPSVIAVTDHRDLPDLKAVISGGESVTPDVVKRWAPGHVYGNCYGPTENSIVSSFYEIDNDAIPVENVPIGTPLPNMQLYVLNEHLQPLPVGVPGELCIAGDGLARGYHDRADLTAEKFIPNPFSDMPGSRMYRSGDLVRFLADGNIEFLGRIDFQVKIRGFRIELGEIETVLSQHDDIDDAVVLAKDDAFGQKMLVAYIVSHQDVDNEALKNFMHTELPDYMVPPIIVRLDSFPLNASGKVDRRALPEPNLDEFSKSREYVAPRNQTEELIAAQWQDILKLERISVTDSFFDLGGHSLMATQLVSRIRDAFDVELPLRDVFETPTVSHLALLVEQARLKGESLAPPIEKLEHSGDIPLSFSQQRLWFLDQLAPNNAFYNIPGAIKLSGALNVDAFERSIQEIIRRHDVLRTTFAKTKGKPHQVIHDGFAGDIAKIDITDTPSDELEDRVKELATKDAQTPFNLESGPLFRITLLILREAEHVVLFNMHHTISDGWSAGVLVNEFAQLYAAYSQGEESPLDELPIQYADYAVWQQNWLQGDVLENQLNFWKDAIGVNPPVLELPTDRPRPAMQTFNGDNIVSILPKKLLDRLHAFCQQEGVTPFMFLLAAYQSLLHRYSGQDEILVGSPIANRTNSQTEKLIGFFVNTLVMKADFSDNPDFRTLLRQVREMTLNAYAHQDIPFEQLVEALQPEREMSHSPLFQTAFILQNAPVQQLDLPDISITPVEAEGKTSKYDLTLNTSETPDGLFCHIEYNTDLFDRSTMERLLKHFQHLVQGILSSPRSRVSELPIMPEGEFELTTRTWNNTDIAYPDSHTVHQLFEEWAEKQPDAEAARYNDDYYSYAELNQRANQLAHYLIEKGVELDSIVGISLERSLHVPVAMLGILKAGAGFLNIDPTYPDERKAYMIQDSGVSVILTQEKIAETLPENSATVFSLDSEWEQIVEQSTETPNVMVDAENLAYVIYTSGSTGRPKGTLLPHRGLCNLHRAQRAAFNIEPTHRVLQFAPLSFDASVWETVMGLLNGACMVYTSQESLTTGQGLRDVINEQQVNIVTLPPSVLSVVPQDDLPSLKTIVTAGEACSLELVKQWGKGRQYVNAYGPTETTVCASYYETSQDDTKAPPIGTAINNFQLYILDKNWSPVPIGVPGELCVGGVGLGRGYLHRPDLTADKFIPNPFADEAGERLYRTGDLVKYLPDGDVEFLGRIDFQVKVRGFRIELGEIEAVLSKQDGVNDVIVLVREDIPGDQRIVAYVVSDEELSTADLKANCRADLPEYMIPSAFVVMEEFPLTPSQKIDRRALPKPELSRDELTAEFVPPRNETEEKLATIVSELLTVEKVGVHDSFFELGGHSLLATQFISELIETFEVEIPLITVFEKPTVAELAQAIEQIQNDGDAIEHQRIEQADDDAADLLSDIDGLSDEELKLLLDEG